MQKSLVLLGDSILDNAPYTGPQPDTTAHLRRCMPEWAVQRLARDGARMSDVESQLRALNGRASVCLVSIGGNDALQHIGLLDGGASTSAEVLDELLRIAEQFAQEYQTVIRSVIARVERAVMCTIYEAQLQPARSANRARIALAILNDRIIRIAAGLNAEVLELRSVCTEPEDFVLQIEPSARGAEKIANAIASLVRNDAVLTSARVFAA